MKKLRIGFVGVGCISGIYLENITKLFKEIEVIGVCDLVRERAEKAVETYHIPKLYEDMYALFDDPDVDIVLNITRPYEHYEVTRQALLHGKHVYSEKPLSPSLAEARELYALAQEKGLYLGGAPDTFMGAGLQTARQLIDNGFIGKPIGARAHFSSRGPETWHPDPEFFYRYGGGPMLDMGPYYVTALINMLGQVDSVSGMAQISYPTRPILNAQKFGQIMPVEVPTYVMGQMKFTSGAIASIFTSFDISYDRGCQLEVYGSEGTLFLPDPNTFGGPVKLLRGREREVIELPLLYPYAENARALGLADMAKAIQTGRRHRANSAQQLHVVETMLGFIESSRRGAWVKIESAYERPALLKRDALPGILDDGAPKKLTILGDSYSTYAGGVPEGNYLYYPNAAIPDVAGISDTWWKRLIERRGMKLLVNDSSSGTTVSTRVRENHQLRDAFVSRMQHSLGAQGVGGEKPDVILIFGATNDSWIDNEVGALQFADWSQDDLKRVLPAYCYLLDFVKANNPQAEIVGIINCDLKPEIQQGIAQACAHYGVKSVQLRGISKINGHPDNLGMRQICDQVDAVLE